MMGKKEKIEIAVTGILFVVLVFFVAGAIKKKNTPAPSAASGSAGQGFKEELGGGDVKGSLYARLSDEADRLGKGRDPFQKTPVASLNVHRKLDLQGIAWDEDHPSAILNGEIVEKGSVVGGHTVMDITEFSVIVSDGFATQELSIAP